MSNLIGLPVFQTGAGFFIFGAFVFRCFTCAALKISDFVLFGGSSGVEISSATNIQGGSIGSFTIDKNNRQFNT